MSFRECGIGSCLLALAALTLAGGEVNAQVASVTVDSSRPYEEGVGYTYVEATMRGTVQRPDGSLGSYAVPMILIHPSDGGNGVGVVDWPNSGIYAETGYENPDEASTSDFGRRLTGSYLFDHGYTYASVQWNKEVFELFGEAPPDDRPERNHLVYGSIENGEDGFAILRDAARFLKDPAAFEGPGGPAPVETTLSLGFSQTGSLQLAFLSLGENLVDGAPVYDGHLVSGQGSCRTLSNEPPMFGEYGPCPVVPSGHPRSPVISIQSQADLEVLGSALVRNSGDPNWRQYELTGVSHLPAPIAPGVSATQNPIDPRPVYRAALANLARWTADGVAAPPSRLIEGELADDGTLTPALDSDGNALGGLRLPHLTQVIEGQPVGAPPAGAPLGTYTGILPHDDVFVSIGGAFFPFSDEELSERYRTHEEYVDRVTRAADHLLSARYIPEEDRDAYVTEAGGSSVGR